MKKTVWTTALILSLATNFNSGSLFARGGQGNASNNNNNRPQGGNFQPKNFSNAGQGGGQSFKNPVHVQQQNTQPFRQNVGQQFNQNHNNQVHNNNQVINNNLNKFNQNNQVLNHVNSHQNSGINGSPQIGHHPVITNQTNNALKLNTNQNPGQNHLQNLNSHLNQNHQQTQNLNHQLNQSLNQHLNSGKLNNLGQQNAINLHNNLTAKNTGIRPSNLNHVNGLNHLALANKKIVGGRGFNPSYVTGHQHNHISNPQQQFVSNKMNFGNGQIHLGKANYIPAYNHHAHNYHGYWNLWGGNNLGGYGWNGGHPHCSYNYLPYFWGLGGWGLGSMMYGSGYLDYYNPYCVVTSPTTLVYNYTQPIPVAYNTEVVTDAVTDGGSFDPNVATGDPNIAATVEQVLDSAVGAFKQNNYDQALDIVNNGIQKYPSDSVLHEFRGLVLFAKGDYQQAAATVHSILAVGPGWNWTTLSGMYSDVSVYTLQLRALEAAVKANPDDPAGRFLLAYHYMSDGYPDSAVPQLQRVVDLIPRDQVAANLLRMLNQKTGPDTTKVAQTNVVQGDSQPDIDLPSPDEPAADPVDQQFVVGDWRSNRDDGSVFNLQLTADKAFVWSFTPKGQAPQKFAGTYTVEGNTIALERKGGGSLVAQITPNQDSSFNFKMVGAPDEDPGLTFVK